MKKLINHTYISAKMLVGLLFKRVKTDVSIKWVRGIILLVTSLTIGYFVSINAGLLWFLFLAFAFYDWDNRIIGVMALISLASCPFLLQFKKDASAEQMAVYAFFFLTMVVTLQLIEYKRHPELFKDNQDEEK